MPVAVNCCVAPLAIDGFAGVTAIDSSVAAVTVSTVEPVTPSDVAVIVDGPVATPVARPAAVIVATDGRGRSPRHLRSSGSASCCR